MSPLLVPAAACGAADELRRAPVVSPLPEGVVVPAHTTADALAGQSLRRRDVDDPPHAEALNGTVDCGHCAKRAQRKQPCAPPRPPPDEQERGRPASITQSSIAPAGVAQSALPLMDRREDAEATHRRWAAGAARGSAKEEQRARRNAPPPPPAAVLFPHSLLVAIRPLRLPRSAAFALCNCCSQHESNPYSYPTC